tara:strand:- start:239 stop:880 length:642 start_codon:yes stop_codon:yes gene_type:complete
MILIALITNALTSYIVYRMWNKSPQWAEQYTGLYNALNIGLLLLPIPIWIQSSGAEFGSIYYCLALTISGLIICLLNSDQQPLQVKGVISRQHASRKQASGARKTSDFEIQRRLIKCGHSALAVLMSAISAIALMAAFTGGLAWISGSHPEANLIIGFIAALLLVWPLLANWLLDKSLLRSALTCVLITTAASLVIYLSLKFSSVSSATPVAT